MSATRPGAAGAPTVLLGRRVLLILGLVVVLMVASVVVGVVLRGDRATPGVRAGAAFEPSYLNYDDTPRSLSFELPVGPLVVSVGTPVEEMPGYLMNFEDSSGETMYDDVSAGDDARIVPISWQLEPGYQRALPAYQFHVGLVADGRRYDLRAGSSVENPASDVIPMPVSKALYVVVDGDAADLTVEVEYDGVTQVGDPGSGDIDAGLAAPYYEPVAPRSVNESCSLFSEAQRDVLDPKGFDCEVGQLVLSPYVAGLGWVDSADETFVSVPIEVGVDSDIEREPGGIYDVQRSPARVLLDGRPPETTIGLYESFYVDRGTYVFRSGVGPGELELTADLVGTRRNFGRGPETIRFGGTQVFTLR